MNVMDLLAQARPASLDPEPDPARRARDLAAALDEVRPGEHTRVRRPSRRLVVAGGVAVLAGGAAAVAGLASSGERGSTKTGTVQQAILDAFSGVAGDILYTSRRGTADGGVVTDTWWYPVRPRVGHQVRVRADLVGADHEVTTATEWIYRQPAEAPNTAVTTRTEMIDVRYRDRTWSRQVISAAFVSDPTFNPGGMRELVATGVWQVAGVTRIGGQKAIKLTRHWSSSGATDRQTLWVDAGTYLPIRLIERDPNGSQQVDFRFLAPSAANLAKLTVTVPPGFTKVPHS
jgi:hypothetical protein